MKQSGVSVPPSIVPPLIVGAVSVLLVSVSATARVAKSASEQAASNCAIVPERVLLARFSVLFVSVSAVSRAISVRVPVGSVSVPPLVMRREDRRGERLVGQRLAPASVANEPRRRE
jgi:hypothetical protein